MEGRKNRRMMSQPVPWSTCGEIRIANLFIFHHRVAKVDWDFLQIGPFSQQKDQSSIIAFHSFSFLQLD